MRIDIKDKRCIKEFIAGRPCSGHKLSTDGHQLNGHWLGGNRIAAHGDGYIIYPDIGSRAAQTVQRAVAKMEYGTRKR